MSTQEGLSYPISVYFRTKEVIPLIKIGTIPSTGSMSRGFGRMIGADTASYAKSSDIALAKVMDKNSIQYISNLVRSKGLNFPANLSATNVKVILASSKNSTSYAAVINADSTDANGALSKDTQLISKWMKLTMPQKDNAPMEQSVIFMEEYNPSQHRATNATMSIAPISPPSMMMPVPSVGGKKTKRRKHVKKSSKYRKTLNRRKSTKRRR